MPLMVDKMLAKGALDGRNEIVSVPSLFELEGAITMYTIISHLLSMETTFHLNSHVWLDSYKESLMPLMVDKMLAKGALDGRNEIVSVTSLELEGAITTYIVIPHIFSTETILM